MVSGHSVLLSFQTSNETLFLRAVVASVAVANAHTWGLNSSYAVFLAYYLRAGSIGGASPLAFAFVGGLSISTSLLVSPLVTWCIGKFGTVPTFRVGVVLEA